MSPKTTSVKVTLDNRDALILIKYRRRMSSLDEVVTYLLDVLKTHENAGADDD